jgi:hypothetical protein
MELISVNSSISIILLGDAIVSLQTCRTFSFSLYNFIPLEYNIVLCK